MLLKVHVASRNGRVRFSVPGRSLVSLHLPRPSSSGACLLDPKPDLPDFGRESFERGGKQYPSTPKWEWLLNYCDFLLREATTEVHIPVVDWMR